MSGCQVIPDRVAKTFTGHRILITGGTGFMGKVLLEKILRVCPDVGGVILLIRQKKGKEPRQRLEQMFQGELFEPLVKARGIEYLLSRTRSVAGDVSVPHLAMSEPDRSICRDATIIIHSAACVRFDQGLRETIFLNTRGTKSVLELAKECPKLALFIHVSTAYCHPDIKVLKEQCYPPPADPHEIIKIMETSNNDMVNILTPKLLGSWPNTYVYSKALAETLVCNEMDNIPAIVIRPSVVIPVYKEPVPGWTDNLNGPAGLLMAAGKGVLRTMYGNDKSCADFVPVDVFASCLMLTVWNCLSNGQIDKIYNCTSSDEIRISWSHLLDVGRNAVKETPFNYAAWYPGGSMTKYRLWHTIRTYLFHWLPAIMVDTLLFCFGIKPVLLRVHRRIHKGMEVFEYYTNNEWQFQSRNLINIRDKMNSTEKKKYKLDREGFDLKEYFRLGILSMRRYMLKQADDTLPAARRHMKILWCLDVFVKIGFLCLMIYWTYQWINPLLYVGDTRIIKNKML